jgi:hypothetical protein
MTKLMPLRWAVAFLFILFVVFPRTYGEYPGTPLSVVRLYCNFDLTTGRISTENFDKLPALVTRKEEPGWDTVVVVSGFKILSSEQTRGTAVVTVQWDVLGYSDAESVTREQKSEVIAYQLKLLKGLWRIDSPVIPPHVSLPTLRAFISKHFRSEPKRQSLMLKNLDVLREPANIK